MLLREFLRSVYLATRLGGLAPGTVYQLNLTVTQFEAWNGSPVAVESLNESLVRDFLVAFKGRHSGATVNTKRSLLLAMWRAAWQEGLLLAPPRTARIPKAKWWPKIPEAWTPDQVGRILAVTRKLQGAVGGVRKADWWTSLFMTAFDTGERRGALLAVRPADVALDARRITFRKTKTGRLRVCRLHPDTIAAISRIYDPLAELVWPWPFSVENLSTHCRRILQRASVPHGKGHGGLFHKFRRTSGTLIEANGGDGARHIGNTRQAFVQSYLDPRFLADQLDKLPRPKL